MTFTYAPGPSPDEVTLVRFHIADTVEARAIFSDEEIEMIIAQAGSWQNAVISCLQVIETKIALKPDYKADWLTVERRNTDWQAIIEAKKRELDTTIGQITATVDPVYRSDSFQTEAPEDW